MRRRADYLVCKRDGRREWLRATKLARSLAAALEATGDPAPHAVAVELASAVLEALRRRSEMTAGVDEAGVPRLTTLDLAAAAERALWVSGRPQAAVHYAAVRHERFRRTAWDPADRGRVAAPVQGLRPRLTFDHN